MFCPNCGTKVEDGALFCGECGTRLEEAPVAAQAMADQTQDMEQYSEPVQSNPQQQYQEPVQSNPQPQQYYTPVQPVQQTQPPKEKKPFKINAFVVATIILAVVFVASVSTFIIVGKNTYSAKAVATDYFKAIENCDWDTAYDMMDISESEFINKELFVKAMADVTSGDEITKFAVNVTENDVEARATVAYRTKGEDYNDTAEFVLNRQNKKNLLIFDSWKVSPKTYIAKDVQIAVPNGAKLYMDGEAVDESYKSDNSDSYTNYYVIPKLFKGYHSFNISVGDFEGNTEGYTVDYDNDYFSMSSINIDESSQKEIIDTAYDYTTKMIDAAAAGQQFSTIQDLFTEEEQDDAKDRYENNFASYFYAYNKEDGITAVTLTNVKADIQNYYVDEGKLEVYVVFNYHVKNDGVDKDWWSGELKNGTDEGDESSSMVLTYQDGEWLVDDYYSFPAGVIYNTWFYN